MFAALTEYLPATRNFLRQIVPPVLATLIAAVLIAGFNRAFTVHLVQPRMAALHSESTGAEEAPASTAATTKRPEGVTAITPVTGFLKAPERIFAKETDREAEKDQAPIRIAAPAPPPAPAAPRVAARKAEPQIGELRPAEPRIVAGPVLAAPAPALTPPPVTQQPAAAVMQPIVPATAPTTEAPVIAAKPMVTVPDRARPAYPAQGTSQGTAYEAAGEPDAAPAPRPAERFVDKLRPSALFDRMREFGERIEAAGNEILPSIRQ